MAATRSLLYEQFFEDDLAERYGDDVAYMTYVYTFGRPSLTGHGARHREVYPRILQEFELARIVKVSCASYFSLALTAGGAVYLWGQAEDDGSFASWYGYELEGYPARPTVLGGGVAGWMCSDIAVSTPGGMGVFAGIVSESGEAAVWWCDGDTEPAVTLLSGVERVGSMVLGDEVGAVLTLDGAVYEFDVAELAGNVRPESLVAVRTEKLADVTVTQLAAGSTYLVALDADGNMYTWGNQSPHSNGGFLGHGSKYVDPSTDSEPRLVEPLAGRVRYVSAGWIHTMAVDKDGQLWAWGDGHDSRLGLVPSDYEAQSWGGTPRHAPARVEALAGVDIVAVSNSRGNEAALSADNRVYTWGGPRFGGQFHAETPELLTNFIPLYRNGVARIQQIACGRFHTVLVTRIRLSLVELSLRHLAYNPETYTRDQIEALPLDLQDLLHQFMLDRRLEPFRELTDAERARTQTHKNERVFFNGSGWNDDDDDDDVDIGGFGGLGGLGGLGSGGTVSVQQLLAFVAAQGLQIQAQADGSIVIVDPNDGFDPDDAEWIEGDGDGATGASSSDDNDNDNDNDESEYASS